MVRGCPSFVCDTIHDSWQCFVYGRGRDSDMAHLPKAASEGNFTDQSAAIAMEKARMYIVQNQSVNDMNTYIIQ